MPLGALLRQHVEALAEAPRVPGTPPHARALEYVLAAFEALGLRPDVQRHGDEGDNVVAEIGPADAPLVVVGAHYDSVPGSPGADDNASGVAALLEVARALVDRAPVHRTMLVAFDREEDGLVGSTAFCRALRRRDIAPHAMLSLEMLGYTGGEQTLVPGVDVTRTAGDFLAVVADTRSAHLLDAFGAAAPPSLEMERVAVRQGTRAAQLARLSDHGAFWAAGWNAVLVTDTAFLRNPHYHQPTDVPASLDYTFLQRSTETVIAALRALRVA